GGSTTIGCLTNGVCRVESLRTIDFDKDPLTPPEKAYVLIGGVPFVALKGTFAAKDKLISAETVLDGWDNQITYAVTMNMTQTTKPVTNTGYDPEQGAITARNE